MASPAQVPQKIESSHALLPSITGLAAAVAGIVCGIGYVVVSLHHWRYGIVMSEFLRPRIFAAGVLFLLLIAVPVLSVSRIFALFGLTKTAGFHINADPGKKSYLNISLGCGYYFVAFGLASGIAGIFLGGVGMNLTVSLAEFAGLVAVFALENYYVSKYINTSPLVCVFLSFALLAIATFVVWRNYSRDVFWLTGWFFLIGVGFVFLQSVVNEHKTWNSLPWEYWISTILLVALGFSYLYGRLSPGIGGGLTVPITVYLSATNPACQGLECKFLMVEETGRGIYVISGEQHKAYFIPHSTIRGVYYGQ